MENFDENTIKACQNGDSKAFKKVYDRYSALLFGIVLRYAKDEDEAADILQDTFIKIFQNIEKYQFKGSFEGWLKRIAITTAIDQYHKSKKEQKNDNIDVASISEIDDFSIEDNLAANELLKIIQKLPPGYKMVFNMYVIEGYKHQEIASKLGITDGTSKSQLAKAKNMLRDLLRKEKHVAA